MLKKTFLACLLAGVAGCTHQTTEQKTESCPIIDTLPEFVRAKPSTTHAKPKRASHRDESAVLVRTDVFEQAAFRSPANAFRSVPFYSLNDDLKSAEIDRQLHIFKAGGFGGSFLHSRIGLLTEYLSDDWFKIMAAGVKSSQDLNIDAWFYDEDKWPSGFAGGI